MKTTDKYEEPEDDQSDPDSYFNPDDDIHVDAEGYITFPSLEKERTPEQRRKSLDHTAATDPPFKIPFLAHTKLFYGKIRAKAETVDRYNQQNILPKYKRQIKNGVPYFGTYEEYRFSQYDEDYDRDKDDDNLALRRLILAQPHRIPGALSHDGNPGTETYGPLMLPESIDPIDHITETIPPERRPEPWSPQATITDKLRGNLHEVLDCVSLYTARVKVAAGHRPDADSVDLLHKLSLTLKTACHVDEKLSKRKKRGRPHGSARPAKTVKIANLQLEKSQKNKIFGKSAKTTVTPLESESKLAINSKSENDT